MSEQTMPSSQKAIRSICILRLSALGDVTHVLPVINAIRAAYPDAAVTWICGTLEYRLLQHVPGIRFIVFDKRGGLPAYFKLRKQLSAEIFDVLLHMQVAARANIASLCIRARRRIGWDRDNSRDLHHLFTNASIQAEPRRHQVQAFLAFARALDIDVHEPEWNLPVQDEARAWVRERITETDKVFLLSPCSSHALRNWPVERYAAVADHAASKGMRVVLCGGPSDFERDTAGQIERHMQAECLNLVGQDTLQQLIALLERADIVMSPDSGPAHIANAVGTPVIGLYACTNPARSGPYGSLQHCVDRFPEAARQFADASLDQLRWNKKIEQPGVMELITVADVVVKLEALLSTLWGDQV